MRMHKPLRVLLISVALSAIPFAIEGQSLSARDAKSHIGERATVCGSVAGVKTATKSRGTPTFINLDAPYPNQVFTILIWGEDRSNVEPLPRVGTHACVTGRIQDYRGVPEIIVKTKDQLTH